MELKTILVTDILGNTIETDKIVADNNIANTSGVVILGNEFNQPNASGLYIINNEDDFILPSATGGTVSSLVSFTLGENIQNLRLENAVKEENINGMDCLVYGNPDDNRWILDSSQGDNGIVKLLNVNNDTNSENYPNTPVFFTGDCGVASCENILIEAGKLVNQGQTYNSSLPQFSSDTLLDLRESIVLAKAIQNDDCDITSPDDLGGISGSAITAGLKFQDLLGSFGVSTELDFNALPGLLERIAGKVKSGHGVILSVDSNALWNGDTAGLTNHEITITGVAYGKDSDMPEYFYICDSGRKLSSDASRMISIQDLRRIVAINSFAVITTEAIKKVNNNINGTGNDLDNVIKGNEGDNHLYGGGGNDIITGGGGSDYIDGGIGDDSLTGSGLNDTIIGNDGDDVLYGLGGNDSLIGGDNYDTYFTGGGNDIISDSDGDGKVIFGGAIIKGGKQIGQSDSYKDAFGNIYTKTDDGLVITKVGSSDSLTIEDFTNDNLGIKLEDGPPLSPPPRTFTTAEANALWYDPLTFWKPSNSPFDSSQSFNTIDTLVWNIGLYNLDTTPYGAGAWLIYTVIGNPPGVYCPTVTLGEILNNIGQFIQDTWKQLSNNPNDPIILDLDGDGVELVSTDNKVYFDLDRNLKLAA